MPTPPTSASAASEEDALVPSASALATEEIEGEVAPSDRPDLFDAAKDKLSWLERANIRFNRWTTTTPWFDRICGWCQRVPGASWVHLGSRHIRYVKGAERLPDFDSLGSFVLVSNHRSYFDLFVIAMLMFRMGLRRRILFPVRSNFFYDHPLGFVVNGIMSFWSMYPPVFRDRKRSSLNRTGLNEIAWTLKNTRAAVGLHPEGRRNQGDDPYALLKAQAGLGHAVLETGATVIPVFINGLGNSFKGQLKRNASRKGEPIIVVFGAPVDFGDLLDGSSDYKRQREVAQCALDCVSALGEEERALRARIEAGDIPDDVQAPAHLRRG